MAIATLTKTETTAAENGMTELTVTVTVNGEGTNNVYVYVSVGVTVDGQDLTFYGAATDALVAGTVDKSFVFQIAKVPLVEGDLTVTAGADYVSIA